MYINEQIDNIIKITMLLRHISTQSIVTKLVLLDV